MSSQPRYLKSSRPLVWQVVASCLAVAGLVCTACNSDDSSKPVFTYKSTLYGPSRGNDLSYAFAIGKTNGSEALQFIAFWQVDTRGMGYQPLQEENIVEVTMILEGFDEITARCPLGGAVWFDENGEATAQPGFALSHEELLAVFSWSRDWSADETARFEACRSLTEVEKLLVERAREEPED